MIMMRPSMMTNNMRGSFMRPMFGMGYGGMGMNSYGGGGNGSGYSMQPPPPPPRSMQSYAPLQQGGVSAPSGELLNWPVGLRVIGPSQETQALRQEIDYEVRLTLEQAARGPVDTNLLAQTHRAVGQMRRLLEDSEWKLSRGIVLDARQFLDRLAEALNQQPQ
jgi:hypothetical protein